MFVKDVKEVSLLLDFYGDLLSERKQSVLTLYYNEDFSLAEIADEIGISRQGARELIKKAEEELRNFEEKLGLVERFAEGKKRTEKIREMIRGKDLPEGLAEEIQALSELFG